MIDWVEQQTCIKFCIKLQHSYVETIRMIQKAVTMGNWWLAASSLQYICSHITSCADFFGETWNHPGDSAPLQLRLGNLWLLAFPKTKISVRWWHSGKYDREDDGNCEKCVRSQDAYFEGDSTVIVLCIMFLVCYIVFNKCLYFSYYMVFWTDLVNVFKCLKYWSRTL